MIDAATLFRNTLKIVFNTFIFCAISSIAGLPVIALTNAADSAEASLQAMLPDSCQFSGKFEQHKQLSGIPDPLVSSGQVFFSCHHGLIWQQLQPFNESVVYTNKGLHFRSTGSSGAENLEGPQHEVTANLLINLLGANIEAIIDDFSLLSPVERSNSTASQATPSMMLKPANDLLKRAMSSITIDKLSNDNIRIQFIDNLQQRTLIKLFNIDRTRTSTPDSLYRDCQQILRQGDVACSILHDPEWQSVKDFDR